MYHSPDCAYQASDLTWFICGLQIRNQLRFLTPECEAQRDANAPLVNLGGTGCTASAPCGVCHGDCDGDQDCNPGLKCFERNGDEQVPGCAAGGSGDSSSYDYCHVAKCGPSVQMVITSGPERWVLYRTCCRPSIKCEAHRHANRAR